MQFKIVLLFTFFVLISCSESAPPSESEPEYSDANLPVWGHLGERKDAVHHPSIAHVKLVDVQGDGNLDVLVCDVTEQKVSLIEQMDDGSFVERTIFDKVGAPVHAELADIDGDGDKDILVAAMGVILPSTAYSGQIYVLENDGNGNFQSHLIADNTDRVTDVRAGDFDGDGDLDIASAQFGYTQGKVRWYENLGLFNFQPHVLIDRSGAIHAPVVDIDNDGDLDIVALLSQEWETVVAFVNDGKGNFMPVILHDVADADFSSSGIAIADLDSDGDADVIWTNGDAFVAVDYRPLPTHGLQWLENKGKLEFEYHRIGQMNGAYSPRVIDFDLDGDQDIITVSEFAYWDSPDAVSLRWWSQEQDGSFSPYNLAPKPTHLVTCDVGDIDNDGAMDIVAGGMALYPPFEDIERVVVWNNPLQSTTVAGGNNERLVLGQSISDGVNAMVTHANGMNPEHFYLQLIEQNQDEPKWIYLLGIYKLSEGNSKEALSLFLQASDLTSEYGPLQIRIGELYAGMGEIAHAKKYLSNIDSDYARTVLAQILFDAGEHQQSIDTLSQASHPNAQNLLALIRAKSEGKSVEIENALDMGLQINDPWKKEMESYCDSAPMLITLAQTAVINNDLDEAISLLNKAILCDPHDCDARLGLANILLNPDRLSAEYIQLSLNHLESGLSSEPEHLMARSKYAWALYLAKKPIEARNEWNKILAVEPNHGPSMTNLAQLELQFNNNQQAYDLYKKSFLIPDDAPFSLSKNKQLRAAMYYRFAIAAKRLKKVNEAERALIGSIELDSENATYMFELGNLYIGIKSYDQAERYLLKALQLDADNVMLTTAIGYMRFNQSRYSEAVEYYQKAISIDSSKALTWYHLANAQFVLGMKEEALLSIGIALRLQPSFPAAKQLLEEMTR
ncbi:MAG: FG-GAP-like repeat-containing protein [Planctomycetota bacterium]|nr:FG-GAP-like repeat-containing protein [Planctomycetota bacterium]